MLSRLRFCESFVHLDGKPISFAGRPYLPAIYAETAQNLVLRTSRQVEKTTFLANLILHAAFTSQAAKILFVCPRQEQARLFSNSRLRPALEQSPLLRRALLGQRPRQHAVENMVFANGSQLYVRSAFRNADAARGISANLLVIDEFQDIALGVLPVLQETLSHTPGARTVLTGTPKLIDNHLEAMFNRSTANHWRVACKQCQRDIALDESCLGLTGVTCPHCKSLADPRTGRWVASHPEATWGAGYTINHLMVPWMDYADVLSRQQTYDATLFQNEVLGLPTILGDHIVTRTELEACCTSREMLTADSQVPAALRPRLVAGIDWGGGGNARTVLVIGYCDSSNRFQILFIEALGGRNDPDVVVRQLAERCRQWSIPWIAADGNGSGHVYNRLLLDQLPQVRGFYAIHYSVANQDPIADGRLTRWTVSRSASIGVVFSRVKKQLIQFPKLAAVSPFLDELACEVAEYDDQQRSIRYTHPQTQRDDTLHALNYALLIAHRLRVRSR